MRPACSLLAPCDPGVSAPRNDALISGRALTCRRSAQECRLRLAGWCILSAMNRTRLGLLFTALAVTPLVFHAQAPSAPATHKFIQIAPGVYSAVGVGAPNVGSNSAVIINSDDVVVVDAHISPEAGRVLLREIKTLTDKPVRTLIDTHFHYDHTNGNQAFAPTVEIIGHEFTRRKLAGDILQRGMFADLLRALPQQLSDLRSRAA